MAPTLTDMPVSLAAALPGIAYIFPLKLIFMLVLAVPWLLVAPWVYQDSRRVRAPKAVWPASVLASGGVGLLVWLFVPYYIAGLLVYVALAGTVMGSYVAYRNGRVEDEKDKVLTGRHLASLLSPSRKKQGEVSVVQRLKVYDSRSQVARPPDPETDPETVQTYNLAQNLLYEMIWRRASQADLVPAGQQVRFRMVIDGVVSEGVPVNLSESEAVVQYLKGLAGMEVEDRRRPQHGSISVDLAGANPINVELTTTGTTGGQRLQFKVVQEMVRTDLNDLGISEPVLKRVSSMNHAGNGLIIVSGKAGNGVTSTLYSLLMDHDAFMQDLVSLETRPKVDLENIAQNEYEKPEKLPQMLSSVLRHDPSVVMMDRCQDGESAEQICSAAASATILLGERANDSFTALAKWVRVAGNAKRAVGILRGVTNQVLVRRLCPTCREAYRPDPQLLAKVNLPAERIDTFYRPPTTARVDEKGQPIICPTCQGSGYHGRTAVFELLEVTDELRQLVVSGASVSQIKAACRKNKMLYLQEQALLKVMQGETSVQEVIRVSQSGRKT